MEIDQKESIVYKSSKISAWRESWEEADMKGKVTVKRRIMCTLFRTWKKYPSLNLGECNDGAQFSAVSQAINEAKWLVDYDIEKKLESKLFAIGFKREDLFKYNGLKIWDRLKEKEQLILENER